MENTEKMGLAWSLKPIITYLKICGLPAHGTENRSFLIRFVINIIVCLSLFINISCSVKYMIDYCSYLSQSNAYMRRGDYQIPFFTLNYLETIVKNIYSLGIPLLFAIEFYITGRWQEIWNCIMIIDQEIKLPRAFYRKCRKCCIITIFISFMELLAFLFFNSNSLINTFDPVSIFELLKGNGNVTKRVWLEVDHRNHPTIVRNPAANRISGFGASIWIQSSVIAVMTIFLILTWTASLLAEELVKRSNFMIDQRKPGRPSLILLNKWMREMDIFNRLVDEINDCFGLVLLLALSHILVISIYNWYYISSNAQRGSLTMEIAKDLIFPIVLQSYRLLTIVIASDRLQMKAKYLKNYYLSRAAHGGFNSKMQLQFETAYLQLSTQADLKITASKVIDIDFTLILSFIGTTLTYSYVLYKTFGSSFVALRNSRQMKHSFATAVTHRY